MTASLPTPGGSIGTWGDDLNAWLRVGHNADGTTIDSGSISAVGGLTIAKDLPNPVYIAHRGGAAINPENTREAFECCIAQDIAAVEGGDVYLLRDGALGVMHDDTIDRTTSGTGNTADQNAAIWRQLTIDNTSGSAIFPTWPDLHPPFFDDILRSVAGRALVFPEAKNAGAGQKMFDALKRRGMLQSCIMNSQLSTEFAPFLAAGIPVAYIPASTSVTPATIIATGATWVALTYATATTAYVTSLVAAGLKVIVCTGNTVNYGRRKIRDQYLALGVSGFWCDDPLYTSGAWTGYDTFDPSIPVWRPGMIPTGAPDGTSALGSGSSEPARNSSKNGAFTSGRFGFFGDTDNDVYSLLPLGPIADRKGSTYQIDFTITYDALSSDSTQKGPIFFFGGPDDRNFQAAAQKGTYYYITARENGQLVLNKIVANVGSALATASDTAITVAGQTKKIRINVTPTSVTVTNPDTGASATKADSTIARTGGYCGFGKNDGGLGGHYSIGTVTVS